MSAVKTQREYDLQTLLGQLQTSAGDACDAFREYKGGLWCDSCGKQEGQHWARTYAARLKRILEAE